MKLNNVYRVIQGTKVDTRKKEKSGIFVSIRTSSALDKHVVHHNNLNFRQVSFTLGQKKSKEVGAASFIECSALERTNVELVFQTAEPLHVFDGV